MAINYAKISQGATLEPGLIQIASLAEALAGLNEFKAITPALLESKLAALVDAAPGTLDTLNELAAAIGDDANFSATIAAQITNLQNQINSLSGGGASNQVEVDNTQASAGLAVNGDYIVDSSTNFLGSATTLANADFRLDAQVKINADAISSLGSGNIAALQSELDATQASVGLGTDGTLGSYANSNFYSATATIKAAVAGVDAQAKDNETDITAQGVRITSLESTATNQAEVDAIEAGVGLSTAGAHVARSGTNYLDTATSIVGEISLLDAQVDTNEQDIATINTTISTLTSEGDSNGDAIDALQVELDATQAGAGLSNLGAYSAPGVSNYLSGAATLKAADSLLDTQIKANETNITSNDTDISALQTNQANIEGGVGLDGSGNYSAISGANFATSSTSLKGAVTQLDTQLNTTQTDLDTAEASIVTNASAINTVEASVGLSAAGAYVQHSGSNFIDGGATLKAVDLLLDTQVKANVDSLATKATAVQLSALDLRVTNAEGAITSNDTDIATLNTLADTHEASIGLNTSGGLNYSGTPSLFSASASLTAAIQALDGEVTTNAGDILGNANQITAQIALNNTQETAIGLNANGTHTGRSGTNFINSASSIAGEITLLDTQLGTTQGDLDTAEAAIVSNASSISTNTANISSNDTEIQALEDLADTHETNIGLDNDGGYTAISGANFATSGVSIKAAITQLDTQLKTTQDEVDAEETARAAADNTLSASINTVEASVGLGSDGSLTISGTNFIDGQSTLLAAATVLDTNINLIDQIQDNIRASAGLSSTGTKTNYSSTNIIANANSLKAAIEALDVQVNTNATDITSISGGSISALQTEVNSMETALGLDTDGTFIQHSGSNFMDATSTAKAAREALDTKVKTVADELDTAEAAIVSNDTDIASLQGRFGGMFGQDASHVIFTDAPLLRGHFGPFEIDLFASIATFPPGVDFIFYGETAERAGDRHFAVDGDGSITFTGRSAV